MSINQKTYRDWVLGILVYMLVLTLFDDYTDMISITSASTVLLTSIVLQALTYWTLGFKKWVGSLYKYPANRKFKPAKFFSLWGILFFSKFIFLWIIDFIFGSFVEISGFISLLVIIITMTIIKESLTYFDTRLAVKN